MTITIKTNRGEILTLTKLRRDQIRFAGGVTRRALSTGLTMGPTGRGTAASSPSLRSALAWAADLDLKRLPSFRQLGASDDHELLGWL